MWPRCTPIQQALFRSLGSYVPSSFFRSLVRIPFQFFRVFSCIGSGFFCCFACVLRSCPIGDRAHGFIAVSARMHLFGPVVASSACSLTDEFAWWSSLPRLVGVGWGVCSLISKGQGLCRVWPGAPLRFSLLDCRSIVGSDKLEFPFRSSSDCVIGEF